MAGLRFGGDVQFRVARDYGRLSTVSSTGTPHMFTGTYTVGPVDCLGALFLVDGHGIHRSFVSG